MEESAPDTNTRCVTKQFCVVVYTFVKWQFMGLQNCPHLIIKVLVGPGVLYSCIWLQSMEFIL